MVVVIALIVVDNDPPIIFSSASLPYRKVLQFRALDLVRYINNERSKSHLKPISDLDIISDSKTKIYNVSIMEMDYLAKPGLMAFNVSGRQALGSADEVTPYMYVVHRSNDRPALRDSLSTGCFLFAGQKRKFVCADIEDNRIYVIPYNSPILELGAFQEKFNHILGTRRYLPLDVSLVLLLLLQNLSKVAGIETAGVGNSGGRPSLSVGLSSLIQISNERISMNLSSFMNNEKTALDGLPSSQGLESITNHVFFTPYGLDLAWAATQSPSSPNVQVYSAATPWPHHLIVTVKPAADCFTYRPKPDFSVWLAGHLLRLSVEIESQPDKADYNRLLIEAASAVRMANIAAGSKQTFINSIYVDKTWETVSWNFLFEREDGSVACAQKFFNLSNPVEALQFVRNLYQARDLVLSENFSGELIHRINNLIKSLRTVPTKGSFTKSFGAQVSFGGATGDFDEPDGAHSGGQEDAHGGGPDGGYSGGYDDSRGGGYDDTQDGGYDGTSYGGYGGTPDASHGGSPPRYSYFHSSTSLGQYQLLGAKTANVYLATARNGSPVVAKKVTQSEGQIYCFLMDLKGPSQHILFPLDIIHMRRYDFYVFPRWVPVADVIDPDTSNLNIPDDFFVSLCVDLISALSYLHKNLIAHLDVKPENMVINHTYKPKLKLIDFNLAIRVQSENERVCHVRGTMGYVAPEVLSTLTRSKLGQVPPYQIL
ncbi:hypothetical protein D9757_015358 [Collybiopsis confluens]|uniref:Protein kinase domain-containing protein n=1 Tax=Collybiopsis confluens TaxID=2823264 RepID=A0A8H5C8K7_9AGAR|nr:hypothetical protein D9757_015358 [Collybiopsis confluens]